MSAEACYGVCKDCKFGIENSICRFECLHPKVFGKKAMAVDGCSDWTVESDIDFGPQFGCVHFVEKK